MPIFAYKALAANGSVTTGELDAATRRVIAAFQMKYRNSRYDGQPDAETAARLGCDLTFLDNKKSTP